MFLGMLYTRISVDTLTEIPCFWWERALESATLFHQLYICQGPSISATRFSQPA